MRQRYYNTDIKRFINQDILTGSITDSQSLNRYSYVEGNPVSFLDPFGLSKLHNTIASIRGAYNIIHKALADPFYVINNAIRGAVHIWRNIDDHTKLNILGTLPVFGYVFDIANAISYFKEGNVEQGIESLIFALPTLNIAGGAGTIAKLFTSSQKTADAVGNALQLIGSATAAFTATAKVFNGIADMFNTYYRGGAEKDERFYAEAGEVFAYALMASVFGTMAMKDARAYFNATELIDELQIFEKGRVVNDEEIEWIGDKNEPLVDEMYYFRGTTVGYPGNQSIQRLGVTPTSSDPLVATVFATNGEQYGNGVVYIASSKDLDGISQLSPNVLADEECEVVFDMQAIEFANKASINVSSAEARSILRDLGYDVPSYIPREDMSTLFTRFPKLKQEEIIKFVKAVGG